VLIIPATLVIQKTAHRKIKITGATIAIVKQVFTPKVNRSYDCHCKTGIYILR
jgi:hypothetical protein